MKDLDLTNCEFGVRLSDSMRPHFSGLSKLERLYLSNATGDHEVLSFLLSLPCEIDDDVEYEQNDEKEGKDQGIYLRLGRTTTSSRRPCAACFNPIKR